MNVKHFAFGGGEKKGPEPLLCPRRAATKSLRRNYPRQVHRVWSQPLLGAPASPAGRPAAPLLSLLPQI